MYIVSVMINDYFNLGYAHISKAIDKLFQPCSFLRLRS